MPGYSNARVHLLPTKFLMQTMHLEPQFMITYSNEVKEKEEASRSVSPVTNLLAFDNAKVDVKRIPFSIIVPIP